MSSTISLDVFGALCSESRGTFSGLTAASSVRLRFSYASLYRSAKSGTSIVNISFEWLGCGSTWLNQRHALFSIRWWDEHINVMYLAYWCLLQVFFVVFHSIFSEFGMCDRLEISLIRLEMCPGLPAAPGVGLRFFSTPVFVDSRQAERASSLIALSDCETDLLCCIISVRFPRYDAGAGMPMSCNLRTGGSTHFFFCRPFWLFGILHANFSCQLDICDGPEASTKRLGSWPGLTAVSDV